MKKTINFKTGGVQLFFVGEEYNEYTGANILGCPNEEDMNNIQFIIGLLLASGELRRQAPGY